MKATPQSGIFAQGSQFYLALEYRCGPAQQAKTALKAALQAASAATNGAHVVFAFGSAYLDALQPGARPGKLKDFTPITGAAGHSAPASQRDLLIWIHGPRADANFDLARTLHCALQADAELMLEVPGFNYHENRDMTGFIDGTANPQNEEALEAALIPEGQESAGGSYVLSMQYVHDLAAFNKLSISDQERVIGRTKLDSIELRADLKPGDAHISRAEISEDGVELKIYRRSFPYGGVRQHGLYFLAFACDQHRFDAILENMYGVSGDGLHDHLLQFTRAVSGSYWFAPSQEVLQSMLS